MLLEKHKILAPFLKTPWEELTLKKIRERTGKNSKSYIYNSLEDLVDTGVLDKRKVGRSALYRLNIGSRRVQSLAGAVSEWIAWHRKNLPTEDIERISTDIPPVFYSLIITGSYARGEEDKDSDLDVVLVCPDNTDTQKVYASLRHECELNIPPIHLHAFTASEFYQMLVNDEENFGKETARNNLILNGGEEYYRIISEAVKNGFKG